MVDFAIELSTLITPSTFGLISFLSCICVALEAWADWRAQGSDSRIVTRIQVVLQVPLALFSLSFMSSIFLANYDPSVYFGNDSTCQVNGFLLHVGSLGAICVDMSFFS